MSTGKYSPIVLYFSEQELKAAGYDRYGYSDTGDGLCDGPDPMGYTEDDYLQAAIEANEDGDGVWFSTREYAQTKIDVILKSGALPPAPHPLPDWAKGD